jgi:hypothetical protein
VGFSAGDAFPQQARAVFSREGHQPGGGIEHRDGHRGEIVAACMPEREVDDHAGTGQVDEHSHRG